MLGANNYGKAETRLVRVTRGGDGHHELVDLNVSVALAGDLAATHQSGDNAGVLPTDTQKNTVYAFAREFGAVPVEAFARRLAQHFVDSQPTIALARVSIEEYAWRRLGPHAFARGGEGIRTAAVSYDGSRTHVVAGITDLVLLNTTDSEFHGFAVDRYTTLAETTDRILATAVAAQWRYDPAPDDFDTAYAAVKQAMIDRFVGTYSYSLQQTLAAMGEGALAACPEVAEIRLSLPNKHHFLVDLAPFQLENPGEVYIAADRPYGLIEGTIRRDDAVDEPLAWALPR